MKSLLILLCSLTAVQLIAQSPSNDDCTNAIDLGTLPYCETTVFTNINATTSSLPDETIPECFVGGSVQNDVWFTFQIAEDSNNRNFKINLTATDESSILQPQLAVYRGACSDNQLSLLGVCASAKDNESNLSVEALNLKPNTTYFLRINDYSATAAPNWGNFTLCIESLSDVFILGETSETGLCKGTLYDSGGPNGNYNDREDHTFTICPNEFHRCIAIDVTTFNTEEEFDILRVYSGKGNDLTLLKNINGQGQHALVNTDNNCVTINFTSDPSNSGEGFELTWQCSPVACPEALPVDCDAPNLISRLPFQANNLSTCFAGNNVEIGPCGKDEFLGGDEYIFAYDSPGGECIAVTLLGANPKTGLSILRGCPKSGTAVCIDQKSTAQLGDQLTFSNVSLKEKGRYFFLIANERNCTPFDFSITTSSTCPQTFPSAALCNNALILNGCDTDLPTALTVEFGAGDNTFFQKGVNNGCWENVFENNYTWFTFEAQADGEFAFIMRNNDPDGTVDIDFNIWGPFNSFENACSGARNFQPIRSSFADDLVYILTGLANVNPVFGTPVTAVCESSESEGFLKPLQVKKGEVYVVLINDFDGVIFSGAINIDFSETTAGVLSDLPNSISQFQDTVICVGDTLALAATGASAYKWQPSDNLSCRTCPNPTAVPTQSIVYTLEASNVCSQLFETVNVSVIDAQAGDDQTVCVGATLELGMEATTEGTTYSWSSPSGLNLLSCSDCPNPVWTAQTAGTFDYIFKVEKENCQIFDTIQLTVLEGNAPTYQIADDPTICLGDSITLGSNNSENQTYEWTAKNGDFRSMSANLTIQPTKSNTYFLTVSTDNCAVSTVDSVMITISELPISILQKDTTVCQGTIIPFAQSEPQTNVTYNWTSLSGTPIIDANQLSASIQATDSDTYVLTASNGGCTKADSMSITVILAEVDFVGLPRQINLCLGDELAFNLTTQPANLTPRLRTLGSTLDTTLSSLFLEKAQNQIYVASIENDGCVASDTLAVQVDSLPFNLAIMPNDTSVCQGTQLVLQSPIYRPDDYPNITHQWMPEVGFDSPDSFYNLVLTPTDTVLLKRVDKNGACVDTAFAQINVQPFVEVPISPAETIICPDDAVDLLANLPDGATDIQWLPDGVADCLDCSNPTVTVNETTEITLTGKIEDCPLVGSSRIEVINYDAINLFNPNPTELVLGQSIDSLALDLPVPFDLVEKIVWTADGVPIPDETDTILLAYTPFANEPATKDARTVTIGVDVQFTLGCSWSDNLEFVVLPPVIPNVFTPGQDGTNDNFNLQIPNAEEVIDVFQVYNRWGTLVYDNDDPVNGWNGNDRNVGKAMPAGVYLYRIQYRIEDAVEVVKGNLTLIR
ncbi:MAG: gliding motility-associated C-terminal domain-containing protein [Bacteroidota bacterium]